MPIKGWKRSRCRDRAASRAGRTAPPARARHERADAVEVVHRLEARRRRAPAAAALRRDRRRAAQRSSIDAGDAHQHATADHVEQALEARTMTSARMLMATRVGMLRLGQHPVVDLEHEDRPGQLQQVDRGTEGGDADEGVPAAGKSHRQLRAGSLDRTSEADGRSGLRRILA